MPELVQLKAVEPGSETLRIDELVKKAKKESKNVLEKTPKKDPEERVTQELTEKTSEKDGGPLYGEVLSFENWS